MAARKIKEGYIHVGDVEPHHIGQRAVEAPKKSAKQLDAEIAEVLGKDVS